jgi:hypothetical protein
VRFVLVAFLTAAFAAPVASAAPLPPRNAPYPQIAAQILREVSESKATVAIRCADLAGAGATGNGRLHATRITASVLTLSMDHVCWPLAVMWGGQPIFTGKARDSISFAAVDAAEILQHAWVASRGAPDAQAECAAARATWKWLRRSTYAPSFKAAAKARLLDNRRRPAAWAIAASCVGP